MIGSSSFIKSKYDPRFPQHILDRLRVSLTPRPRRYASATFGRSLYKSHLAFVNICSGSTLNQHFFDSKIVNSFYSTAEEKPIISFYHLHHSNAARARLRLQPQEGVGGGSQPVSSMAVLSKSTKEIYYIDRHVAKAEDVHENLNIENEIDEGNNQPAQVPNEPNNALQMESNATNGNELDDEAQHSRLSGAQLREYIEKLEKKNPFKEINTSGMKLSPCGKKVLVGYSDEHLKFWEIFKSSDSNKDDLSLTLLSEWR